MCVCNTTAIRKWFWCGKDEELEDRTSSIHVLFTRPLGEHIQHTNVEEQTLATLQTICWGVCVGKFVCIFVDLYICGEVWLCMCVKGTMMVCT